LGNFGRVIAYTDAPCVLLCWSDNMETLFYTDVFGPTINAAHSLEEHFFLREEELYRDLMFDLKLHVGSSKVKMTRPNQMRSFRTALR
jgi:hypothetical protein